MKTFRLEDIVRPNIADLVPYSSARNEYSGQDAIFFDANENPFNRPYNRYPDPLHTELRKKVSVLKGVEANRIFVGNGSDEAIDLLIRAFCIPGNDHIVVPEPSYGMYEVCASINDVKVYKVLLNNDFSLDQEKILQAAQKNTKLIFICSPNNPTGNSFDNKDVLYLLEKFKGIVVIDEAYIDFAPHGGFIKYLAEYPNLVILQTFSKAWGMAGIRLGFAFAERSVINILNKIKYPYNVNRLTQNTALDMLEKKVKKEMWVRSILNQKKFLQKSLGQLRFIRKIYPSDANFFLVKVDDPVAVYNFLESEKLIVRNRSKMPLCEGCLRITVGTEIENKLLIHRLREYQENISTHTLL
jgi:histidinol-phosphate aminotransferase